MHETSEAGLEVGVESEVAEMVTADNKTVAQPSKTLIKIIADRLNIQCKVNDPIRC